MKRAIFAMLLLTVSLLAADFWQSKSFTGWNDKDVQKMLDNSPWSKQASVPGDVQLPRASGRRSGPQNMDAQSISSAAPNPADDDSSMGVGKGHGGNQMDPGAQSPPLTYIVRWESALPVRQARMRAKYGSEAAASPEARRVLDAVEPNYLITVTGLIPGEREDPEQFKKAVMMSAALVVRGKDPIRPIDFTVQRGKVISIAVFAFPRTAQLSLDDKEVEFAAKFRSTEIRQRFQFKNMVFYGKLEL